MKLNDLNFEDRYIHVDGDFKALSSAPYRGGTKKANNILNYQVEKNFNKNVKQFDSKKIKELGLNPKNSILLMTSANVQNYSMVEKEGVKVITTAGISGNTINTIILLDYNLTESAMANTIIVASEAKSKSLIDINAIKNGKTITGTMTDAIVIACYGSEKIKYAGSGTEIGEKIYSATEKSVQNSLQKNGLSKERHILDRLEERGINVEDLVNSAFKLSTKEDEKKKNQLREEIRDQLNDKNIKTLFEAVLRLNDFKDLNDAASLVSDEMIGIEISEYIYGRRAFFNYVRYDKNKPGIISQLDPFLDDAISALIGGCMTKIFDEKQKK